MVFKTKELSNALEKQLKNLMTHFLGKVPVVFRQDLVAVHKIKTTLTLNRPAYVGMCMV